MNKKKLVSLCLVLALAITAAIGGTMAYFTDESEVATNTFTVGNVQIELDEADVNEYGEPLKDGSVIEDRTGADRELENTYKLIPGHKYVKDPTVTVNEPSEPAYVRIFVEFHEFDRYKAAFGENYLPQDYLTGWDPTVWECVAYDVDTGKCEFRYIKNGGIVDARKGDVELEPLFTHFTIPATADYDALKNLDAQFVTIKAEAIQEDGFENAAAAWDAIDNVQ